jgi:nucleoside-diphosphate-sugar epimerase
MTSYCYICVHILLYLSSYCCICVLILLYMCPHTATYALQRAQDACQQHLHRAKRQRRAAVHAETAARVQKACHEAPHGGQYMNFCTSNASKSEYREAAARARRALLARQYLRRAAAESRGLQDRAGG